MSTKKKIKAIILIIWFILSIPVSTILCLIDSYNLGAIAMLNILFPFALIISDKDLINMDLW